MDKQRETRYTLQLRQLLTDLSSYITPHKLRLTFGTDLYQETGDIYLVADVLGHSDVGTTKKHYAAIKDQNRRKGGFGY